MDFMGPTWSYLWLQYVKQVSHCLLIRAINKLGGNRLNGNIITNEVGTKADLAFLSKPSAKVIQFTPATVEAELELAA